MAEGSFLWKALFGNKKTKISTFNKKYEVRPHFIFPLGHDKFALQIAREKENSSTLEIYIHITVCTIFIYLLTRTTKLIRSFSGVFQLVNDTSACAFPYFQYKQTYQGCNSMPMNSIFACLVGIICF